MTLGGIFLTSFCNKHHRLRDGKPVEHECYVLPTAALAAEKAGRIGEANELLSSWKKRRHHSGVRAKGRA